MAWINLHISEELHDKLRHISIDHKIEIRALIVQAIEKGLKELYDG